MSRPASSRRSFLGAGAAIAWAGGSAVAIRAAAATAEPDPIFALIEAEKAHETRWCDLADWHIGGDPVAGERAWSEEGHRYDETVRQLYSTLPATGPGLVALVERFEASNDGCLLDLDDYGLRALLHTVSAFARARP